MTKLFLLVVACSFVCCLSNKANGITPVQQQIIEIKALLAGMQVGMITNPTSVDEGKIS